MPSSLTGQADPSENGDSGCDSDSSDTTQSNASLTFSPAATLRDSPVGYKTALSARIAGRAKMVTVGKPNNRPAPAARTKRQSSIRQLAAKLGAKAARREVAVYKPREGTLEKDQAAEKQSTGNERSGGAERRSRRLLAQRQERLSQESKQVASIRSSKQRGIRSSPSKPSKLRKKAAKGLGASPSSSKTDQAASSTSLDTEALAGAAPSSVMMADWEIAPGRIQVGSGANAESECFLESPRLLPSADKRALDVAFSSSFLAQGRTVPVVDGATFQVLEIEPGASVRWAAEESKSRLCSVARGIIRVSLPDTEFPIGPNGMWKVKQGVSCTVVNPFYLGAVVHVTTIGEEWS
jgi:hypothetical protein